MTRLQVLILGTLSALLLVLATAWWRTVAVVSTPDAGAAQSASSDSAIDDRAYTQAQRLAARASEPAEQSLAQSALRLTDHDMDLAFSAALRQLQAHPVAQSPEELQINARIRQSQQQLDADKQRVAVLKDALARAAPGNRQTIQDELDLAQSQVDLEQDELEEANQDLEEIGGNPARRIAREMQEHDAAQKAFKLGTATPAATGLGSRGLIGDWRGWLSQQQTLRELRTALTLNGAALASLYRSRVELAAAVDASKSAVAELAQHTRQSREAGAALPTPGPVARNHEDAQQLLTQTRVIGADQNQLALLDQRIQTQRSLTTVYGQWGDAAHARADVLLHSMLGTLLIIAAVLTALVLLDQALRRFFSAQHLDRRTGETVRSLFRVCIQVLGVLVILFQIFGMPNEFGTLLGLIGAGLTVALKDFIVAILGWVVLMGRNGIRLGDWVEINGVSGEVIELGLLHTVLLETGSWNDAGHPTGRRVTFTNSYAIEGHYFNFSTSGQWLWDELKLVVPAGRDPHPVLEALRTQVVAATSAGTHSAEQEWRRAIPGLHGQQFSGEPSFSVKPVVGGVEVSVRYLTRAEQRVPLRATLNQAAVDLLSHAAA